MIVIRYCNKHNADRDSSSDLEQLTVLFYILSYAPGIIWQEDPAWWNNCSAQGALTNPEGADPISRAKVWSRCMGFNSIIKYLGQLWVQRNLPRTKIWVRFHLFVRIKLSKSFEEEPARKHELRWLFDWHLPLPVTWRDIQALTEIETFFWLRRGWHHPQRIGETGPRQNKPVFPTGETQLVGSLLSRENPWGGWDFAHWDGGHMQGLAATNFLWDGGFCCLAKKNWKRGRDLWHFFFPFFSFGRIKSNVIKSQQATSGNFGHF